MVQNELQKGLLSGLSLESMKQFSFNQNFFFSLGCHYNCMLATGMQSMPEYKFIHNYVYYIFVLEYPCKFNVYTL